MASLNGMFCLVEDPDESWSPVELHLNLWELQARFMDIGLMVPAGSSATQFHFLLPWPGKPGKDHRDLSSWFADAKSVAAIFNETWIVQDHNTNWPIKRRILDSAQTLLFGVVDVEKYLVESDHVYGHCVTVNLKDIRAAIGNFPNSKLYMRFRVFDVPADFYEVGIDDGDRWWKSSWSRTEIIEFRLNVRRSAPTGVETGKTRLATFSKVHLFLMREKGKELVYEDKNFMGCRSLEDEEYWSRYTKGSRESSSQAGVQQIKSSIGYQWTKRGDVFSEFSVVARFKTIVVSLGAFLITAVALGAFGSGLWDGVKLLWCLIFPGRC